MNHHFILILCLILDDDDLDLNSSPLHNHMTKYILLYHLLAKSTFVEHTNILIEPLRYTIQSVFKLIFTLPSYTLLIPNNISQKF